MRRTLIAATTTTVLAAGLLVQSPAQAAANAYVVSGHPITAAAGLTLVGDTCAGGGTPPTVTELERDGGTVGSSALGFSVNQAASEAGPVATLQGDPASISVAEIDVFAPTGTSGHVYARFPVDANSFYVGFRSFTMPAGQWISNNLVNVGYYWSYYENGQYVSTTQSTWTIQSWADGWGATSAQIGVLLGCGGEQFFVDDLRVANAANSATYDFEKKPTSPVVCHPGHVTPGCPADPVVTPQHHVAHLEWSTDGRAVQDGDSVTIRYGQSLWMLGHGHVHADTGNLWYSGVGTLTSEPTTGSALTVLRGAFGPTTYASLRVAPTETTIYRFTADAHEGHAATLSDPVTVRVQSRVRAKVVDRHLVEGQRLAVKGKIAPEVKGVKVTLERKLGGRWRNLTSSRTGRGGKFTLDTVARDPGSWTLRVKVATTSGNVGTMTESAKVKVDRYVPPKPKQPPPPPEKDPTPEVTAPVDTAQPTQVTTTAPTPPDRPTATGRVGQVRSVATTPVAGAGAEVAKP